ncbi:hypothetical protein PT974_01962 [Cladobotryum mycophilum]|uniref:BTB domain-containing protein n=1 Tax=Cladobotryum mycophilum TaxID=491253 RepID=A0ABR0SWQ5_9HYPO
MEKVTGQTSSEEAFLPTLTTTTTRFSILYTDLDITPPFDSAMAPTRKKGKHTHPEDKQPSSGLASDYRIAWLLASDDPRVEIKVKEVTFRAHKSILSRQSEYFNTCLNKTYREAVENSVSFDDIEPRYMAYYLGIAYSYSSIVPHTPPIPSPNPEASVQKTCLRDYIEVYKLCDRFLSEEMSRFMIKCINTSIGDGHRALYRSSADKAQQKILMRDFADGYEALETAHDEQKILADRMIEYFCEGIDYEMWDKGMDEVMDRPRFVAMVSKGFARKLAEAMTTRTKLRRKELSGP